MNKTQFEIVIDCLLFVVLFWIVLSIKVAFSPRRKTEALQFIVNWKDGIETLSNGKPVWNKFSKNWHVMIALKSLKIALKGRDRFCRKCVRRAWYPTSRYAIEVERAGAQLVIWLELSELSQLGSAQLTILKLKFQLGSAQLANLAKNLKILKFLLNKKFSSLSSARNFDPFCQLGSARLSSAHQITNCLQLGSAQLTNFRKILAQLSSS